MLSDLKKDLKKLADPQKAKFYPRFFKTGPGQYSEGDKFIGVTVPNIRAVVKKFQLLSIADLKTLLKSPIHEERLCSLLILVDQFGNGDKKDKDKIYNFYLSSTKYINNWDLVDLSADKIVGEYLQDKPRDILLKLAKSKDLWERRMAVVATFSFIKKEDASWTIKIAKILLNDKHDLIQKAVGWMLREVGKRVERKILVDFLDEYANQMPRTTLRYAIEHFPENERQKNLRVKAKP